MTEQTQELIERASTHDETAIDALLERHLPALLAYVRVRAGSLIRRYEAPEDLAQSVCRDVLADIGEFEYRGDVAFRHWLFQRAYHKILDRYDYYTANKRDVRRQRAAESANDDDDRAASLLDAYRTFCTPSRDVMAREALARVEAAIDRLPGDYRTAIALHRIVGLSTAEIAKEMDRSEGAVRNLIYRGLARIGLMLTDDATSS